jgi:Protein of unknown function (DUF3306)
MANQRDNSTPFSLRRWSQRKLEASREASTPVAGVDRTVATPVAAVATPDVARDPAVPAPAEPVPLPPIDTLTIDSDFTAFLRPKVDARLKQAALKKLFGDPQFNVMDGLDIYISDYTQPDPMPAGMLDQLAKAYDVVTREAGADAAEVDVAEIAPAASEATSTSPDQAAEAATPTPTPVPQDHDRADAAPAPAAVLPSPSADQAAAGATSAARPGVPLADAGTRDARALATTNVAPPESPERHRS